MVPSPRSVKLDSTRAVLAAIITGLVVYGSLYPFHFIERHGSAAAAVLWSSRRPVRSDFAANLLLYVPIGFFIAGSVRKVGRVFALVVAVLFATTISVALELTQFYIPERVPGVWDVVANAAGGLVGAAAGVLITRTPPVGWLQPVTRQPFPLFLLAALLATRLYPYVPVIDYSKYRAAIKPLYYEPAPQPLDLYRHFVIGITVLLAAEAVTRRRTAVLLFLPALLAARVVVWGVHLSSAEVYGAFAAMAVWMLGISRWRLRFVLAASLFTLLITLQALEPFQFTRQDVPFGWIPFRGFFRSSIESDIRSFFEKVFLYGSMVWLLVRSGWTVRLAAGAAGALVLALRLIQVYIPGRSAEITDFVMVIIMAIILKFTGGEGHVTARPS